MTVSGPAADVRWGYYPAARLSAWSLTRGRDGGTVTATVIEHDAFKLAQAPLHLVAANGWKWSLTDVQIAGSTLTARVI